MSGEPAGGRREGRGGGRLREALLEAARTLTIERGWHQVRMGLVAEQVGVSRQTLHTEFGTKEQLGQQMVLRETERFLTGVRAALESHPRDLGRAVYEATRYTLREGSANPLVHTVLTSARGGDDALLPLLTTRSAPVLHAASAALLQYAAEHHPELVSEEAVETVDALVRLAVSHLVLPEAPPEQVAAYLARFACRQLGLADPRLADRDAPGPQRRQRAAR